MGHGSNIGAAVDYEEAPLRLFHLKVAVAGSGGVFSDGYGLGIIGISLSQAAPQLVYLPELFPTDLRASGIGLAIAASRIGSAISTFLLPIVVAGYGVRSALGACVAVLAIGAAICFQWAPETKHVRLGVFDQQSGH